MDARRHRSRGLARVNRLTGWLAGGALVASGAFVALLAHPHASSSASQPSGSAGATSPVAPTTSVDPYAGGYSDGSGGAVTPAPLNPPVQIPQQSSQQAQVSTGAS
jgi:hypothetical protein